MDRQVARLDRLVADIRRARGVTITRAGLIRALVEGAIDSGFDVTAIASELDIRERVTRHLRAADGRRIVSSN